MSETVKENKLSGEELIATVKELVLVAAELNVAQAKVEDLAIVLEKVFGNHIDVTEIDFTEVDLAADKEVYADLVEYAYTVLTIAQANGLNRNLVFNLEAYNAAVDAYELAINTTLVKAIAPAVIKAVASMASEKLGGYVAKLINALEIEELSNEELLQDLPGYAKVLRDLQAVNAYAYVLNKEDIAITDADAFAQLAEDALSLVVVDNKFADLLVKLVEKVLGVDFVFFVTF